MKQISLSPSKLNLFKDCPRCFYDAYTLKTPRPRGIMASLMSGIDRTIKPLADMSAGKLPAFLDGKVEGVLMQDRALLKKWGFWRTSPRYVDDVNMIELYGGLDECLVNGDIYTPVDYKTKGQVPKDSGEQYYQNQLDCYDLMLSHAGYKTSGKGYLVYLYPALATENGEDVLFNFKVAIYELKTDIERAKKIAISAVECLRGERPPVNLNCEYCLLVEKKKALEK